MRPSRSARVASKRVCSAFSRSAACDVRRSAASRWPAKSSSATSRARNLGVARLASSAPSRRDFLALAGRSPAPCSASASSRATISAACRPSAICALRPSLLAPRRRGARRSAISTACLAAQRVAVGARLGRRQRRGQAGAALRRGGRRGGRWRAARAEPAAPPPARRAARISPSQPRRMHLTLGPRSRAESGLRLDCHAAPFKTDSVSERIPGRVRGELEIADVDAEPQRRRRCGSARRRCCRRRAR